MFSNESPFQLWPVNQRRRAWRRLGQRADLAITIARHTSPLLGVIVWRAIYFDNRTPLGVIQGTLTAQRYVDDILRTVLLPFLLKWPSLILSRIMPEHIRHFLQLVKHFLDQADH
ncbi:transposable element Tc1 transposase [Trichonephila clavipes]|nr:transposable element Tc1 transposase [Trichonephila clavipes]